MNREVIFTENAPAAVGPYSQAIKTDGFVFISGQLGLDPKTGQLAEGVEAQAQMVMKNLSALLKAVGSDIDAVVKTTIFLVDMVDFAKVNAIYAETFDTSPPARSTVQVAALPLGGLVEIEAVALVE